MTDAAEKILEEAMKLPPEVRSRIAQELMDSVAANDESDDPELLASLERAADDSEAGRGMDAFEFLRQRREVRHPG